MSGACRQPVTLWLPAASMERESDQWWATLRRSPPPVARFGSLVGMTAQPQPQCTRRSCFTWRTDICRRGLGRPGGRKWSCELSESAQRFPRLFIPIGACLGWQARWSVYCLSHWLWAKKLNVYLGFIHVTMGPLKMGPTFMAYCPNTTTAPDLSGPAGVGWRDPIQKERLFYQAQD